MVTLSKTLHKLDTEINAVARAYNQGYQHGLEDMKMRSLVDLWREYKKYEELDPDLAKLIKATIMKIEKLN